MYLSLPDVLEVLDTLAAQIAEEIHTLLARMTVPALRLRAHYALLVYGRQ